MRFDDLDKVYRLEVRLFPNPWPKSFFERDIGSTETIAFVVEHKGSIIGYSIASCVDTKFHITNIAIDGENQRQGIGSELMERLENIAIKKGCRYAYLEVRTNNNAAINFYKHLGYNILYIQKYYYIDGDDAYVMDKELE